MAAGSGAGNETGRTQSQTQSRSAIFGAGLMSPGEARKGLGYFITVSEQSQALTLHDL